MALNHYSQGEHRHRFLARQYCCSTGSTLFRSCQRCWNVYARGGEVWGPTGHHPAALEGPVWPTRQHPNDPVCTETEGGRQAGVRRHGAGWPLLAASAHSDALCECADAANGISMRVVCSARTSSVARAPETGRAGRERRRAGDGWDLFDWS